MFKWILIAIIGVYLFIESTIIKGLLQDVNTNLRQIEFNLSRIRADTKYLADVDIKDRKHGKN